MAKIVVCGGSVVGLGTALMLARDGHQVTVLERDAAGPPDSPLEAWDDWDRSIPQFRQPHNLFPRFRMILEQEMPDVLEHVLGAGGTIANIIGDRLPPTVETDAELGPDDEKFNGLVSRRPVVDYAFGQAVDGQEGLTVERGVKVQGLVTEVVDNGTPHITGVKTTDDTYPADIVIDAMGRGSPLVDWLPEVGSRPVHIEDDAGGFTYYTRYFTGDALPPLMGPVVSPLGTFTVLTLHGDNSTWSVTLWISSKDKPLKAFRHTEVFERVVASLPLHAHWQSSGEPITDVLPMSGVLDRYRRFVTDGSPVATGVLAVGDAWACTNPSAGRGLSIGLWHAQRLRDVLRDHADDREGLPRVWDEVTEAEFTPWYRNQLAADHARLAEMDALRAGDDVDIAIGSVAPEWKAVLGAVPYDGTIFRGLMETVACLALPQEVFTRPGFMERAKDVAKGREALRLPAPTRDELLQLVAG